MPHRIRTPLPGAAALVRRPRRSEARPLVDLSDFQPAELSDFGPALTPCKSCRCVVAVTRVDTPPVSTFIQNLSPAPGIRFAPGALTAGAAKLGTSRVPQHPATLAACRLRS